ncbi:hypothetical protein [Gephyromycinifex aptenodytis]|uniref:hypothetical protein n=1 Tax=Gephyromycinifex aptenodytis TaxID=2716227 RepID=UPI0014486B0B|nr:hypothetical protein [Gephyromycinifex aptenodytis]
MNVGDYFAVLRRYWPVVLTSILLGGMLGGAAALSQDRGYTGQSRIYAVNPLADSASVQQMTVGVMRMGSYEQLVTGTRLARRIANRLDLERDPDALASSLSVSRARDTVVMTVTATGDSAEEVGAVLRVLPEELTTTLKEVSQENRTPPEAATSFVAIDGPRVAPARSLRGLLTSGLLGAILGMVVGLVASALLTRRNPVVQTPAHVAQVMDTPVIAVMPTVPGGVEADQHERQVSVAAHRLALAVQNQLDQAGHPVIAVTGTAAGVGASTTAMALTRALAERGHEVCFVNASAAGGRVESFAGGGAVTSELGSLPTGRAALIQSAHHAPIRVLDLRSEGAFVASQVRETLRSGQGEAQFTVIDLPPIEHLATATCFLDHASAAVLVYSQRTSRERDLERGLDVLDAVSPVSGVLVANEGARTRRSTPRDNRSWKRGQQTAP